MDGENRIQELKVLLDETDDSCRALSDQQLAAFLARTGDDVWSAAYLGAIAKAEQDGLHLPDGVQMESGHDYWLRMAKLFRPNRGGTMPRADGRRR